MTVPPLRHGVLHARKHLDGFAAPYADRDRQIVDDMQHSDGYDEGQIEPVGDIDMPFFAFEDGAHEDREIRQPNDGQPDINVPFRLRVFFGLGRAQ